MGEYFMIRRKNFIFVMLSLVLLMSGCGAKELEDTQNYGQTEDGADNIAENMIDEPDMKEDGDEGFRELTQEELDVFTQFIRGWDAYGFLLSEYTNPVEVDLGEVFYSGAGVQQSMSEDEIAAYLTICDQVEMYTDCVKITQKDAEKLVQEKLGISLEDMDADKIGVYIQKFDAYYHECGDTNYTEFTCVSGLVNGNIYTLEFKTDMEWDYIYSDVQTILEKTESGYQFISNQSLAVSLNDSTEIFEEVADVETAWEYLKAAYFSESELEEISYDNNFQVVIGRTEMPFGNETINRPCASVIFLDDVEEDYYTFGYYNVFYEGDTVYATQTRGWYQVNRYTGEVSVL